MPDKPAAPGASPPPSPGTGQALDPGALEDSFLPLAQAHERRVQALTDMLTAERALSAALDAAVGPRVRCQPAPMTLLDRALHALGLQETPPSPPPGDAAGHEAALRALRALGHQLARLEAERSLLQRDLDRCRQRSLRAARDRDRSRAAARVAEDPATRRRHERDARRFDAEHQRSEDMIAIQEELVPVLDRVQASVAELHHAARGAVAMLARQLTEDASAAADALLRRGLGATARLEALRDTVREVQGLVDEAASNMDQERQALHRRLRMLDAEAEARRAAQAEVDALLRLHGSDGTTDPP